jgi:protein-disulfide isomerase
VANNKKSTPRYDLNAQDRKRDLFIKIGLTALVALFAVGLVLYIVMGNEKKAAAGDTKAVRVSSGALIKKPGTDEPKAVLSVYEDFQCPHCRDFEKNFGSTVNKLVESGAVAVDYYMVALPGLDRSNKGYSTRAANAAYCVGDEDKEAFARFHSALFAQQPEEGSGVGPDNAALIETARQAGVTGGVAECVNRGKYDAMVKGLAPASNISATPTIRLNGEDISPAKPEELISKVVSVVGPVPALMPSPSPAPAPAAPAQ